jgi:hypothetical protein
MYKGTDYNSKITFFLISTTSWNFYLEGGYHFRENKKSDGTISGEKGELPSAKRSNSPGQNYHRNCHAKGPQLPFSPNFGLTLEISFNNRPRTFM